MAPLGPVRQPLAANRFGDGPSHNIFYHFIMFNFKTLFSIVVFLLTNTSLLGFARPLFAQTMYDRVEVGSVLTGGIKMGTFSNTLPLPPGQWQVVHIKTDKIALSNGTSTPRWFYFLKDATGSSIIHSFLISITPDQSNINWSNAPCQSKNPNAFVIDNFGTTPSSLDFACGIAKRHVALKALVDGASKSSNAFVKDFLGRLSDDVNTPKDVVEINLTVTKDRGKQVFLTMFITANGGDSGVAEAMRSYVAETGTALRSFLDGRDVSIGLPKLAN